LAHETILLVDGHEEALVTKRILVSGSFNVLTAYEGDAALNILERDHVGMVLSEHFLPGKMSGSALLARVRICYPATTVMLMTKLRDQAFDPAIPLLLKPFTANTLIQKVEGLLLENRQIAESLKAAFAWNHAAKHDLDAIRRTLEDNVRQSRRDRCTRFCCRIREPGAWIPTILVAEDDEFLRYSVCHFLIGCGFRVLQSMDGFEALKISREYDGSIDLLLTDIRMPGMTGVELLEIMDIERPKTKVIVMTGEDLRLARQTLRKPFELDDLLAEMVSALIRQ
jgi:CheY-like chemotaxis protein